MKPWQKGYELEYLKKITKYFSDYNEFSRSPFSEMNPNSAATALESGHLEYLDDGNNYSSGSIESHIVTVRREITADGNVVIGTKEKGDRVIRKISGDVLTLVKKIDSFTEPC